MIKINGVIYQKNFDSHINEDRVIATITNGDIAGFSPEQVRVAKVRRKTTLGPHWREYPELYGVIGKAIFTLEDIEIKKRETYNLETGDRLFIPPGIALKIEVEGGTIIVVCSPKEDRAKKSHNYKFD